MTKRSPEAFRVIWPERRTVSPSQIMLWYRDAKANKELDPMDLHHRKSEDMAMALHRAGIITLGKRESES